MKNVKSQELNKIASDVCVKEFENCIDIMRTAALKGKMSVKLYNVSHGVLHLLNQNGFQILSSKRTFWGQKVYTIGFYSRPVMA